MNILVVRTDNIGDMVCTTPLLAAVRRRYPEAWIGVLTNSYSAPVLAGNPDVDEVFVYRKAKHLDAGESVLRAYWSRLRMVFALRRKGIDLMLLAAPKTQASALRFARWLKPRRTLGGHDVPTAAHEAEKVYLGVAKDLDLPTTIPACRVQAPAARRDTPLPTDWAGKTVVGLHISARKPSQRWPEKAVVALSRALVAEGYCVLLFWSPGWPCAI